MVSTSVISHCNSVPAVVHHLGQLSLYIVHVFVPGFKYVHIFTVILVRDVGPTRRVGTGKPQAIDSMTGMVPDSKLSFELHTCTAD
jgi:hypothetical protein